MFGLAAAIFLFYTAKTPAETTLFLPFFKNFAVPMGAVAFIALSYFMIVGMSNAVNLTDGLDGLAIMPSVMVGGALGVFAYASGNANFVQYLAIPAVPGAGEVLIFCAALVGAGSGSCGSTPIRRRCSWVTSARSRSAPRSAPLP